MNAQTLNIICKLRKLSQSDIAKFAGISRQAVSLWFQKTKVAKHSQLNIHTRHLQNLSQALGLQMDDFCRPLPCLEQEDLCQTLETAFNWDRLFPSLEDFVVALASEDIRAMARLVQAVGLFQSEKILGPIIWGKFSRYKKYLPPIQQKHGEQLWNLHKNLKLK